MNPEDFHRLAALDDALEEIAAAPPAMSELVLDAHEAEDTPGHPSRTQWRSGLVSSPGLGRLAGTVRWAVVPYAPRPPFRIYAGEGQAPIVSPGADAIIEGMLR